MQLAINPTLELNTARTVFKRKGRVLLPDFLGLPGAQALGHTLAEELPYRLTMNTSDESVSRLSTPDLSALDETFRRNLMNALYAEARTQFRYMYAQFEFDRNLEAEGLVAGRSREIWAFLNSTDFLKTVGKIIGVGDLKRVSAQASSYAPGHFLTQHDDDVKQSGRRAAFVLYMSPRWLADWGGLLQFIDRDGHVAEAFTPTFNALAVFKVPTEHAVSMITPLAPRPRLAISGWVH
jgi:Rps23 Pro-64 3,4-dihydroxylase Tpa1-like proline 4-hydroxylase